MSSSFGRGGARPSSGRFRKPAEERCRKAVRSMRLSDDLFSDYRRFRGELSDEDFMSHLLKLHASRLPNRVHEPHQALTSTPTGHHVPVCSVEISPVRSLADRDLEDSDASTEEDDDVNDEIFASIAEEELNRYLLIHVCFLIYLRFSCFFFYQDCEFVRYYCRARRGK